jgi:hypothetical protein
MRSPQLDARIRSGQWSFEKLHANLRDINPERLNAIYTGHYNPSLYEAKRLRDLIAPNTSVEELWPCINSNDGAESDISLSDFHPQEGNRARTPHAPAPNASIL